MWDLTQDSDTQSQAESEKSDKVKTEVPVKQEDPESNVRRDYFILISLFPIPALDSVSTIRVL